MHMHNRRLSEWFTPHGSGVIAVLPVCLIALLLGGCAPRSADVPVPAATAAPVSGVAGVAAVADVAGEIAADAASAITYPTATAQDGIAASVAPLSLAVREVIEQALPSPPPSTEQGPVTPLVSPAAVDLIVGFEIVSKPYYAKHLQGVVCPPRQSGPTRGIGWDDGHQTPRAIAAAWPDHPQLERILPASGQVGAAKCNAYRRANPDIRTPLAMAEQVFTQTALPAYHAMTARAFRNGWDALPANAQGALVATVYNRGASMLGSGANDPRKEMRVLRDVCVPAADVQCMAEQFLSMRRLWPANSDGGKGLQRRYTATAALAVRA